MHEGALTPVLEQLRLFAVQFSQADPWVSSIRKFNAGSLKCFLYFRGGVYPPTQFTVCRLEPGDCWL